MCGGDGDLYHKEVVGVCDASATMIGLGETEVATAGGSVGCQTLYSDPLIVCMCCETPLTSLSQGLWRRLRPLPSSDQSPKECPCL